MYHFFDIAMVWAGSDEGIRKNGLQGMYFYDLYEDTDLSVSWVDQAALARPL